MNSLLAYGNKMENEEIRAKLYELAKNTEKNPAVASVILTLIAALMLGKETNLDEHLKHFRSVFLEDSQVANPAIKRVSHLRLVDKKIA